MIVGSGKFRYRVNADWAKLPAGWSFKIYRENIAVAIGRAFAATQSPA